MTYDLERHIGSGSFANVYHATHQISNKEVVLKVFDKDNLRAIDIEAARREAQFLKRMSKSGQVIDIFDMLESNQSIALVLPRMQMCLREYINGLERKGTALSEEQVRSIFKQLVQGVVQCHAEGIMHCDLKPENILVNVCDQTGNLSDLKIADFGLSSDMGELSSNDNFRGSLPYMSPE